MLTWDVTKVCSIARNLFYGELSFICTQRRFLWNRENDNVVLESGMWQGSGYLSKIRGFCRFSSFIQHFRPPAPISASSRTCISVL